MASRARNSGAAGNLGNSMEIPGFASAITMAAAGTTSSEAYFMENWKTFLSVSWSFCGSSLLKAGKSMVLTGVAKKVISTTNVLAMP